MAIIKAGPDDEQFDPNAPERRSRTGARRSRAFARVIGAIVVVAVVLYLAQRWWSSVDWFPGEKVVEVKTADAAAIPHFIMPEVTPAAAAPPLPLEVEPPALTRQAQAGTRDRPGSDRREPPPIAIVANASDGGAPDMSWQHDARRPHLFHGCALRPGRSLIPATLLSVVRSEIGGQAIAVVSEDVPDADGVGRTLIPQGTILVGYYKPNGASLKFNASRLPFVWSEAVLPDSTQLTLDDSIGMDAAGSIGVGGEVQTHWGDLIAAAALFTIFDGIQRGATADDPGLAAEMQNAASSTTGKLGKEITNRIFDWEPDIRIPAGTQVRIAPRKTLRVC